MHLLNVELYARKAINVLQTEGPVAIELVRAGFEAYKAFSGRDFIGVFAALNKVSTDANEIIAEIKKEFGLE